MKKSFENVYKFKITLKGMRPKIWRRILVPENMTFGKFSDAILKFMGWKNRHLHSFYVNDPETGRKIEITNPDTWEPCDTTETITSEKKCRLNEIFSKKNKKAVYLYDYGDNWEHELLLEKILPRDDDVKYPICIDGQLACPPEDVGGVLGYLDFLDAITEPKHPESEEMLEWVGGSFDPDHFEVKPAKKKKTKKKTPKEPEKLSPEMNENIKGIDPEAVLVMVANYLPMVPDHFESIIEQVGEFAGKVKKRPSKKFEEKILVELLALDAVILRITSVRLDQKYPAEIDYLDRAVKMAMLKEMTYYGIDPVALLEPLTDRVLSYLSIAEDLKTPDPAIIFDEILSRFTKNIAGKKPSEEFTDLVKEWVNHYFLSQVSLFEVIKDELEDVLPLNGDNHETADLIKEILNQVPIPVVATAELTRELKKHGFNFKQMNGLKIIDASFSGEAGGIVCVLTNLDRTRFMASLTHLKIKDGHPLEDRITKYQEDRMQQLGR